MSLNESRYALITKGNIRRVMGAYSLTALVAALDGRKHGKEWVCRCPAHDDTNPSLWVTETSEQKLLVHCFSGCEQADVLKALRAKGLIESTTATDRPATPKGIPVFWPPASVLKKNGLVPSPETQKIYAKHWPYRNPKGDIIGHVVRYEGHGKKELIPFFNRWEDGGWRTGTPSLPRPLYNQHLIKDQVILIVEGEKTAEAASKIEGALGVTWIGGCSSVEKADWSPLSLVLSKIIVIPDNDQPGFFAAQKVAQKVEHLHFLDPNLLGLCGKGSDLADLTTLPALADILKLAVPFDADKVKALSPKKEKKAKSQTQSEPVTTAEPEKKSGTIELASVLDSMHDLGNARRFLRAHGEEVRYVKAHGWYHYNGQHWRQDDAAVEGRVVNALEQIATESTAIEDQHARETLVKWGRQSLNQKRLSSALKVSTCLGIAAEMELFDNDPLLLSVANGVMDLKKGSFRENRRDDFVTRSCSVVYDSEAWCPRWVEFLSEIMLGDEEMISYLQRAIGYSLTGLCSEQVMFLLWGGGANGKSVFLETLRVLLGSYASNTSTDLILLDSRGEAASQSHMVARLKGARFVVGSEIPSGAKLNESRVKEMTGEDALTARFLYRDAFDFRPQFKLWVRSNYRPDVDGKDQGIWRRLHTIPFEASIAPEKQDRNLQRKLLAELPGILNWAILGYYDWQSKGLAVPQRVVAANTTYRKDMDSFSDWLEECCISAEPDILTSAKTLYEHFESWSRENGDVKHLPSPRQFSFWLRDRQFYRIKKSNGRYYRGIALKDSALFN